ncbi:OmpA-OmpF porin, OOP family [Succinivibrio dextrinosolvens]|uniref:OmpA family protein n=1 Tax=Succinivibrio dextrinosolvens TaxID=83771 RepID=UPI0008E3E531|nr:OmpA family protein [Succinivibrio dextrinosolvens]SFS74653.1 OmpA-OmpF porin, OOP family [Succinivibrio dextrinosolvens]
MKLNVLAVAVITAFAVGSANAAVPETWTVGAAAGWSHAFDHSFPGSALGIDLDGQTYIESYDYDKNGYGIKLYGEYNFTDWFGLGLGYNYIGGQSASVTYTPPVFWSPFIKTKGSIHANIAEVYGKFAYSFDNTGSDVFFKVGPTGNWASAGEGSDFKLGAVAGIGAQWAITPNFALRGGYDYFYNVARDDGVRLDEGLLYVGFQYTFGGPSKPAPAKKVRTSQTHTLDAGVLFPFDSAKLSAEGQNAVATVVQSANGYENAEFEVYGHTDRIGSDAYNNTLSQKRADAVSAELQNNGVTPKVSEGKGKANPVTGDKCNGVKGRKAVIDCLAPDRRVEIVVTGETTQNN